MYTYKPLCIHCQTIIIARGAEGKLPEIFTQTFWMGLYGHFSLKPSKVFGDASATQLCVRGWGVLIGGTCLYTHSMYCAKAYIFMTKTQAILQGGCQQADEG